MNKISIRCDCIVNKNFFLCKKEKQICILWQIFETHIFYYLLYTYIIYYVRLYLKKTKEYLIYYIILLFKKIYVNFLEYSINELVLNICIFIS